MKHPNRKVEAKLKRRVEFNSWLYALSRHLRKQSKTNFDAMMDFGEAFLRMKESELNEASK